MSTQIHTPGPWHFAVDPDRRISVREDGGLHLAHVTWRGDARLIAAAPDLLASLLEFVAIVEGHEEINRKALIESIEFRRAQRAIAKALGQD